MDFSSVAQYLPWVGFLAVVTFFLLVDLGVFHRRSHIVHWREALAWTIVWISFSLIFCGWIFLSRGPQPALEFLTGYIVEQALSVDNIFVFVVILAYFKVPREQQHRVLYYGILGAILMRGLFICLGAELIHRFDWLIHIFGVILIYTGYKLFKEQEIEVEPERNIILSAARKIIPAVTEFHGQRFFIREAGRWLATPLFFVLISVEITDVIFAVDSIPAIFGVTNDAYIVFTSNICAILGLRSMYFLLAGVIEKLRYLRVGLSVILIFIGIKMVGEDIFEVPIGISLSVVIGILIGSVVISLLHPANNNNGSPKK